MKLVPIRRFLQQRRLLTVRIVTSAQEATGLPEILRQCLARNFGTTYDLAVSELPYSRQVLDLARRKRIDLFLPVLNNMRLNDNLPHQASHRMEAALQVASHLKRTYGIPFIALAGYWPEGWDVAEKRSQEGGASAFFILPVPVPGEPFLEAIQDCLEGKAVWRTNHVELSKVGVS